MTTNDQEHHEDIQFHIPNGDHALTPTKGTANSAAWDLRASESYSINPGETIIIHTGVHVTIPHNLVGLIHSRSGLAAKKSISVLNAPGVIDSDYIGELMVILHNHAHYQGVYHVKQYDRVAQILFQEIAPNKVTIAYDEPKPNTNSTRGANGLGSTGNQ